MRMTWAMSCGSPRDRSVATSAGPPWATARRPTGAPPPDIAPGAGDRPRPNPSGPNPNRGGTRPERSDKAEGRWKGEGTRKNGRGPAADLGNPDGYRPCNP